MMLLSNITILFNTYILREKTTNSIDNNNINIVIKQKFTLVKNNKVLEMNTMHILNNLSYIIHIVLFYYSLTIIFTNKLIYHYLLLNQKRKLNKKNNLQATTPIVMY